MTTRIPERLDLVPTHFNAPVEEVPRHERTRLLTDEGVIDCYVADEEGPLFTLTCNNRREGDTRLYLKARENNSRLIIGSPTTYADSVSGETLLELFGTALIKLDRSPEELELIIEPGTLADRQIRFISELGFKKLTCRDTHAQKRLKAEPSSTSKQDKFNQDFKEIEGIIAAYRRNEVLDEKSQAEWLRLAHILLQYAIVKEAKDGVEAARDHLEATKAYFDKAIKSSPSEITEKGLDVVSQVEYAGTLARLSCCVDLQGYEEIGQPSLVGINRNDKLFDKSVSVFEELKKSITKDTSDHIKSLIISGLAQAHALRAEYLEQVKRQRIISGSVIDMAGARMKSERRKQHRQATNEIEAGREIITDKRILEDLEKQLAEIIAPEARLLNATPEGRKNTADKMLAAA